MVRVPVWGPTAEGANAISKVQLEPVFSPSPQVDLPVLNPKEVERRTSASSTAALEFAMVSVTGLLVEPTPVSGKFRNEGVIWTAPVSPPMPLSDTEAGMVMLDEATVTAPARVPRDRGVNMTLMVQLAPAARAVPQLFWERLNGPDANKARPLAAVCAEFE